MCRKQGRSTAHAQTVAVGRPWGEAGPASNGVNEAERLQLTPSSGSRTGSCGLLPLPPTTVPTSPPTLVTVKMWRGASSVRMCARHGRGPSERAALGMLNIM